MSAIFVQIMEMAPKIEQPESMVRENTKSKTMATFFTDIPLRSF
jgi:hypothetical protein